MGVVLRFVATEEKGKEKGTGCALWYLVKRGRKWLEVAGMFSRRVLGGSGMRVRFG